MNKTKLKLMSSIDRILSGNTLKIEPHRALSIKAVEEEAGLGSGTAYYYKDVITHIKQLKSKDLNKDKSSCICDIQNLQERIAKETRLKEKYRDEASFLKEQVSIMTATHSALANSNCQFLRKINELESELNVLRKR